MNKVQQFLIAIGTAFNSSEASSSTEVAAPITKFVKRKPKMIDRIVFLEDSNRFDVGLCKIKLDKMLSSSFFSICDVTESMDLLKLSRADTGHTLNRLRMLHCVHWVDMPKELRECIPDMISEVLTEGAYQALSGVVVSDQ